MFGYHAQFLMLHRRGGPATPRIPPSCASLMHQVAEKLIKTEVGSLGVISKKKTIAMDDVCALQLVTSKRFDEEERARYKQKRSCKPGEQQSAFGMKRPGDAAVGGDACEEVETVVGKLAADLVAASIADLLKGERVNAEVHGVGGMVGPPKPSFTATCCWALSAGCM